jgi:outer membrane protein assembly factor BamB
MAAPLAGNDVLIADRGNGRLLIVDQAGRVKWRFPVAGSLPRGHRFSADDAFLAPDGRTIVANEEGNQLVVRIDIASRRVVWSYGHYGQPGSPKGYLHTPDDAYPLANGDVMVADIANCRIIQIAPDKRIVRQWGRTGVCTHDPPRTFNLPNGDTPMPDGGLLITEIRGSHVVRLDKAGSVLFDIHVPVAYPSDAQLDAQGNVVVCDYSDPGLIVAVSPSGKVVWTFGTKSGPDHLNHPSLAVPMPNGNVLINDDLRHRVIVVDPHAGGMLWHFGAADDPGAGAARLRIPDGVNLVPVGVVP